MKKKIIWAVVVVLAVVVIGFIFMGLSRDKGFSLTDKSSNTQPMYGTSSYEEYISSRNIEMKKVDDDFVNAIVAKKGSSKAALQDAIQLAWSYLNKKDTDTAMKRCNQAWLIDHTNFNAYWCYGAVLGSAQDFERSAVYFDKAISMYSSSAELFVNDYLPLYQDASQSFINLSDKYLATDQVNAKRYAAKAITLLSDSLKDKNIPKEAVPMETFMLAIAYFNNGSYSEARKTYTNGLSKYPEYAKSDELIAFDKALKGKGF